MSHIPEENLSRAPIANTLNMAAVTEFARRDLSYTLDETQCRLKRYVFAIISFLLV